jgi:hypothetical protein
MTRTFRTLILAVSVAASASVFAQAPAKPAGNPTARGDNVFYYGPLERSATISNPLANSTARTNARGARQVTPVPEPSEWAMMLAGLALVGFIVRRNQNRS